MEEMSPLGQEMHRARTQLAAKDKDVEMLRARVKHLALEEQRVRRRIDETKERTRQVKESKQRTRTLNAVAGDTNTQLGEHLQERRQSLAQQREAHKKAVTARRLALLERHHADFVMTKQQAALNKKLAEEDRQARQSHVRQRVDGHRKQAGRTRGERETRLAERAAGMEASQALDKGAKADEMSQMSDTLSLLAEEEARLVGRVSAFKKRQQREYDALKGQLLDASASYGASRAMQRGQQRGLSERAPAEE
tara:strand:- start:130 stop:885 length:756 start_codon:yes stop_codon:yes gene_type:complete